MEKRKLGEQLVITVDKKKHLMKEVEGWGNHIREVCIINESGEVRRGFAKDLGILNEDGLLPCPFCGEYPLVEPENRLAGFGCHCDKCKCAVSGLYESMEEVIEEWNRRV